MDKLRAQQIVTVRDIIDGLEKMVQWLPDQCRHTLKPIHVSMNVSQNEPINQSFLFDWAKPFNEMTANSLVP
jgi:hypothetical protein